MDGRKYYVRQMRNLKASIDTSVLDGNGFKVRLRCMLLSCSASPTAAQDLAILCGAILARGHARSGDMAKVIGYIGENSALFGQAIAKFAELYAAQNAKDHQALLAAIRAGKVTAVSGV